MLYKNMVSMAFLFLFYFSFFIWGAFATIIKAIIIPLMLLGYKMFIVNWGWSLPASLAIYHLISDGHVE